MNDDLKSKDEKINLPVTDSFESNMNDANCWGPNNDTTDLEEQNAFKIY